MSAPYPTYDDEIAAEYREDPAYHIDERDDADEQPHCYVCGAPVDEDDLDLGTMYAHRICRVLDTAEHLRDARREA